MGNLPRRLCGKLKASAMCAVLFLAARPALADTCTSGMLNTLMRSTCDIGLLQFTFYGYQNSPSWNNGQALLTPQNVFLTVNGSDPLNPSFTLSGNFTASQPGNDGAYQYFELDYTATVLTPASSPYPYVLAGLGAAYGPATIDWVQTSTDASAFVNFSNCLSPVPLHCPLQADAYLDGWSTAVWGQNPGTLDLPVDGESGMTAFTGNTNDYVMASGGYISVSFNNTTASFSIDPVAAEPGSLALLATALGIFALLSRRSIHRLSPALRQPAGGR
jgi:hypothetical protein